MPFLTHKIAHDMMEKQINVPVFLQNTSIQNILEIFQKEAKKFSSIDYIYAVDENNILQGVISIKEFFVADSNKSLKEVIKKNLVWVHSKERSKKITFLSLQNSIKAIPVVDEEKKLLGVILHDTINKILEAEGYKKLFKMGGITPHAHQENGENLTLFISLKHRLPWLLFGLLGGGLTAQIIHGYEEILTANIILAAFLPLMVYTSDAVGTQMEAFIIRDLSKNPQMQFSQYLIRQFIVVSVIGIISSVLAGMVGKFFYHDIKISLVLGISLLLGILSSVFTGLIIPYVFYRLKFDPADASGPIATIIQDALSVFVYFSVATWIL